MDSIVTGWARVFQRGAIGRLPESAPLNRVVLEAKGGKRIRRGHHDFKQESGLADDEG